MTLLGDGDFIPHGREGKLGPRRGREFSGAVEIRLARRRVLLGSELKRSIVAACEASGTWEDLSTG